MNNTINANSDYSVVNTPAWRRSRRMILLIFCLCLLPVLLAYALYAFKPAWLYAAKTNHGELMQPVQALPALNLHDAQGKAVGTALFKGHWSLIYLGGSHCDAACVEQVREVGNIRPLLLDNRKRLTVYYVAPDAMALRQVAPDLQAKTAKTRLLSGGAQPSARAADVFKRAPGSVIMIDPIGDWVLSYKPHTKPKDIYLDLKQLLRYSHIG